MRRHLHPEEILCVVYAHTWLVTHAIQTLRTRTSSRLYSRRTIADHRASLYHRTKKKLAFPCRTQAYENASGVLLSPFPWTPVSVSPCLIYFERRNQQHRTNTTRDTSQLSFVRARLLANKNEWRRFYLWRFGRPPSGLAYTRLVFAS